jgi:hypothetical protein
MFVVTFYGGLAANIGVVLVVGAAIAVDRYISSSKPSLGLQLAVFFILLVLVIGVPLVVKSIAPYLKGWLIFLTLYAIFGLMILIGYAVGIGK